LQVQRAGQRPKLEAREARHESDTAFALLNQPFLDAPLQPLPHPAD
jgi:hypothetical protein